MHVQINCIKVPTRHIGTTATTKKPKEMPRLTAIQRERAVGMVQEGATHITVARRLGCARITITRLMQRLRQTGQTVDRPKSRRPWATTPAEDRHIRLIHLRNRFVTATLTATRVLGLRVSRQTICRRLREHGIRARRPCRRVYLSAQHRGRTQRDWRRISSITPTFKSYHGQPVHRIWTISKICGTTSVVKSGNVPGLQLTSKNSNNASWTSGSASPPTSSDVWRHQSGDVSSHAWWQMEGIPVTNETFWCVLGPSTDPFVSLVLLLNFHFGPTCLNTPALDIVTACL